MPKQIVFILIAAILFGYLFLGCDSNDPMRERLENKTILVTDAAGNDYAVTHSYRGNCTIRLIEKPKKTGGGNHAKTK